MTSRQSLNSFNKLPRRWSPPFNFAKSAPSDQEIVTALERVAAALVTVAGDQTTAGADAARRLAKSLSQLARADAALRAQA